MFLEVLLSLREMEYTKFIAKRCKKMVWAIYMPNLKNLKISLKKKDYSMQNIRKRFL